MTGLAAILTETGTFQIHAVAVFFRIAAMLAVMPLFGERLISIRVKLVVALAFTAIVLPAVPQQVSGGLTLDNIAWLTVTETTVGLMLGLGLRMFVLSLQTAGAIAAQSTSLSQILGGASAEPMPAIGHVLVTAGLALAALMGLHVRLAELMILSYRPLPMGQLPLAGDLSEWGVAQVARAFFLAFKLSVPFVILSVLYNLILGVINRAMPQLMVAFVGAPVITFGGLFVLFLLSPMLLSLWWTALDQFILNPLGAP